MYISYYVDSILHDFDYKLDTAWCGLRDDVENGDFSPGNSNLITMLVELGEIQSSTSLTRETPGIQETNCAAQLFSQYRKSLPRRANIFV
jgi:hypothetical protein